MLDGILNALTDTKIPVGRSAKQLVDWMIENVGWVFDAMAKYMNYLIEGILWLLQTPHPLVVVVIMTAIAYGLRRKIGTTVLVLLGLLFVVNQGYWKETTETLTLVFTSCLLCMAVGVPIGIYAAHRPRFYAFLRPVLDLMQTLPTFVYLIPAIIFFGLGLVPGLFATAIFVLPAPIRLTQLGIAATPKDLLEAGQAFGCTKRQLLFRVELPYAMPQIMVGLTQTIMLSLSMVVIAALVGAAGLGAPVVRALNTVNTSLGFESGLVIVVLAILMDRVFRRGE
ncbi:MAG: choline ABC transporter permease subunit [Paracoccaceae bacterium]